MNTVDFLVNGKPVPEGSVALNLNRGMREQIEYLLQSTAFRLIDRQVQLGNPPSEILVDGVSNKSLTQAKRNIEARFGSYLDKRIIKMVERSLVGNIRRTTKRATGKLSNMANWNWYLQDFDSGNGRARKVNPYSLETLTRNQNLLLVPDDVVQDFGEPYASAADNWLNAKSGGGFMYKTKERLNKNRRFNSFYYCKVGGHPRHALPGEVGGTKKGKPITKCLVIMPRLKKRKSRFKNG